MIICPSCFTRNEENALFCSECGRGLDIPDSARHEFSHGVMRYEPDAKDKPDETPLYLTREAADVIRQDAPADASAAVPTGTVPAVKRTRKKNSHLPAIIIMSVIGILVILIILGIVILLGG